MSHSIWLVTNAISGRLIDCVSLAPSSCNLQASIRKTINLSDTQNSLISDMLQSISRLQECGYYPSKIPLSNEELNPGLMVQFKGDLWLLKN